MQLQPRPNKTIEETQSSPPPPHTHCSSVSEPPAPLPTSASPQRRRINKPPRSPRHATPRSHPSPPITRICLFLFLQWAQEESRNGRETEEPSIRTRVRWSRNERQTFKAAADARCGSDDMKELLWAFDEVWLEERSALVGCVTGPNMAAACDREGSECRAFMT